MAQHDYLLSEAADKAYDGLRGQEESHQGQRLLAFPLRHSGIPRSNIDFIEDLEQGWE